MWNPFKSKTNYPNQVLPTKALEVIERCDTLFLEQSVQNDCDLTIIERHVGLRDQFKSVDVIVKHILKDTTGYYLPRSIAFYINADGTWVFLIGIRSNIINNINTGMWIHILNQTNNARTK